MTVAAAFSAVLKEDPIETSRDTIVLVHENGYELKSRAVASVLEHIGARGSCWQGVTVGDQRLAHAAYDFVGATVTGSTPARTYAHNCQRIA